MNKYFRLPGRLALKLEEADVSVPLVLRRAGLAPDLFQQTRILVTTSQLFAFWHAIGAVSKDPAIGLKLGMETRTERFHPSAIAALSCENFSAAITHMARYKQLTCPEEMLHSIDAEEWTIRFRWLLAVEREPQTLIDYCFAWLQTIGRHGSGKDLRPLRIELLQEHSHPRLLERHFKCPVIAGAAQNAVVFHARDALCPFTTRNAELLDMLAPQFDRELRKMKEEDSLAERVSRAIQERLTGNRPAIEEVARDLHMSARTLQRRLQETGLSYQKILDDARRQMARYYLGNSVLELNEAAYLLGYEDANSFVRAFRSWEGVPPGVWRETHRRSTLQ